MSEEENDEKLIITPEEAEGLLYDGCEYVHNFISGSMMLIGCDYERPHAIEAFKEAKQIEIAGASARGMKHAIAVWRTEKDVSFFEADPEKVDALERSRREEAKAAQVKAPE